MSQTSRSLVALFACCLVIAGWSSILSAADQPLPVTANELLALPSEEPDVCPSEQEVSPRDVEIDLVYLADTQAVCSPPSQCSRNRDCDRICGKGQGTCRRVNSCYSECICNAY